MLMRAQYKKAGVNEKQSEHKKRLGSPPVATVPHIMITILIGLSNLFVATWGLECYTSTSVAGKVSALDVCENKITACLAVVSKSELRLLNPRLANETKLESGDQSLTNWTVSVSPGSIEHQGCFPCLFTDDMNPVRCQSAPNTNQESSFVCCCNKDGCNRADNIDVPPNYVRKDPESKGKDCSDGDCREDGVIKSNSKGSHVSELAKIMLYTLVPACVVGVLVAVAYIFTSCKFSKLNHLIFGSSTTSKSGFGRQNIIGGQKMANGGTGTELLGQALNENQKYLRSIDLTHCPLIGQGKFGQVYKLQKNFMGYEQVAIKVFYLTDRNSWLKEVDIYSMRPVKENSCILRLLAADDRGAEGAWIVTEYHPLGSIYDYLKFHNTVSPEAVIRISESFFSGLAFLHEGFSGGIRIAHRDVKSRNILVKNDFTACIADFGLAMELHPDQEIGCTHSQVGTRRYMAPEVLEGAIIFTAEAFLRIDVYAASLVLWELLNCCSIVENTQYRIPFEAELGPTPSPEEINLFVAERRLRPRIPDVCRNHQMLSFLCETTEECWDHDCEARLSAMCVQQRLSRLVHQFSHVTHTLPELMNSGVGGGGVVASFNDRLYGGSAPGENTILAGSASSANGLLRGDISHRAPGLADQDAVAIPTFFFPNTDMNQQRYIKGMKDASVKIGTSLNTAAIATTEHVENLTPTENVDHQEESPSCFYISQPAMSIHHQSSNSIV